MEPQATCIIQRWEIGYRGQRIHFFLTSYAKIYIFFSLLIMQAVIRLHIYPTGASKAFHAVFSTIIFWNLYRVLAFHPWSLIKFKKNYVGRLINTSSDDRWNSHKINLIFTEPPLPYDRPLCNPQLNKCNGWMEGCMNEQDRIAFLF